MGNMLTEIRGGVGLRRTSTDRRASIVPPGGKPLVNEFQKVLNRRRMTMDASGSDDDEDEEDEEE